MLVRDNNIWYPPANGGEVLNIAPPAPLATFESQQWVESDKKLCGG